MTGSTIPLSIAALVWAAAAFMTAGAPFDPAASGPLLVTKLAVLALLAAELLAASRRGVGDGALSGIAGAGVAAAWLWLDMFANELVAAWTDAALAVGLFDVVVLGCLFLLWLSARQAAGRVMSAPLARRPVQRRPRPVPVEYVDEVEVIEVSRESVTTSG